MVWLSKKIYASKSAVSISKAEGVRSQGFMKDNTGSIWTPKLGGNTIAFKLAY